MSWEDARKHLQKYLLIGDAYQDKKVESEDERVARERDRIVSDYMAGISPPIDPTVQAAYDRTPYIDQYGFYCETVQVVSKQAVEVIREREIKWKNMLEHHYKKNQNSNEIPKYFSEKMRNRVYKGIPQSYRANAWIFMLGLSGMQTVYEDGEAKSPQLYQLKSDFYHEMWDLARNSSTHIRQIDLDVARTYQDTTMYRERYGVRQQALFKVLSAYSVYHSDIGYCQGMSAVAAFLLTILPDDVYAFWALDRLLCHSPFSMRGLYMEHLPKLMRCIDIFNEYIMPRCLPKVNEVLRRLNLSVDIFITKWIMPAFLHSLPYSLCLRFWDAYLLEGEDMLLAMSTAVLRVHTRALRRATLEELSSILNEELKRGMGVSNDEIMRMARVALEELRKNKFNVFGAPQAFDVEIDLHALWNKAKTEAKNASAEKIDESSTEEGAASASSVEHHYPESQVGDNLSVHSADSNASRSSMYRLHQIKFQESSSSKNGRSSGTTTIKTTAHFTTSPASQDTTFQNKSENNVSKHYLSTIEGNRIKSNILNNITTHHTRSHSFVTQSTPAETIVKLRRSCIEMDGDDDSDSFPAKVISRQTDPLLTPVDL